MGAGTATEQAGSGPLQRHAPVLTVAAGAVVLIIVHAWWLTEHRRGQPMYIDEPLYLWHSMRVRAAWGSGLFDVLDAAFPVGPTAPLIPAITVPSLWIFGNGATAGYAVVLAFIPVLLLATYAIAIRVLPPWWAAGAALVVGVVPETIQWSRVYVFALPAAAFLAIAVALMLHSDGFRRVWPALGAGAAVGLMLLSRTMTLAFLPGLGVAALLAALATPSDRRRRLLVLLGSCAVALVVAAPWYARSFEPAIDYLRGEADYVDQRQVSLDPDPFPPAREVFNLAASLYLPLTVLFLVAVLTWAGVMIVRRTRAREPGESAVDRRVQLIRVATDDATMLVIVLALGFVVLVFGGEAIGRWLALVPLVVVLAFAALHAVPSHAFRVGMVGLVAVVCVFNLLMKSTGRGPLADVRELAVGDLPRVALTDGRDFVQGWLDGYEIDTGAPGSLPDSFREWEAIQQDLVDLGASQPVPAVGVPVADLDPLVNPVNVTYLGQRRDPQTLVYPLILGYPGGDVVKGYRAALRERSTSGDVLVTIDPPPRLRRPAGERDPFEVALEAEGFEQIEERRTPDGRQARTWVRAST